jgi:hypothetical protein
MNPNLRHFKDGITVILFFTAFYMVCVGPPPSLARRFFAQTASVPGSHNEMVDRYDSVTTAQSAALSDEVTAVNILGRRMVEAVTLVQALGGGWERSSLPARPECCGKLTSNLK